MNIGIIGLGRMGTNHLRVLCNLKEQIDEICIYDTDKKVSDEMAKIYGVKSYNDINIFLDNSDAVIICTPTPTHYEIAKLCIEKNKDILIEKPITSTTKESYELLETIRSKNLMCMVGHIERYNPAVIYLLDYIKDKKIVSIEARRISKIEKDRDFAVDVVTDLMIHDIDIILTMTKSLPITVTSVSSNNNLDEVFSIMQFSNGLIVHLASSRISHKKIRELNICTENENIYLDYLKNRIDIVKQEDKTIPISKSSNYKIIGSKETIYFEGEPLKIELQNFIECLKSKITPLSNAVTGCKALDIAKEIVNNTRISKEVVLSD